MKVSASANDASFSSQRARSVPVLSSMSSIRGYPSKLKIFRIRGSRFWQMRCYMFGHMYVRSTRSQEKQCAMTVAKEFYEELLLKHRSGIAPSFERETIDFSTKLEQRKNAVAAERTIRYEPLLFRTMVERALDAERGRMMRGELAMQSFKALRNRLQKQINPVLGQLDIRTISHNDLQRFMDKLVQRKASSVTIAQYMQAIRLVFKQALIEELIDRIPPFPKLRLSSQPRGGFTLSEYRLRCT
jgi:hypothetical protein